MQTNHTHTHTHAQAFFIQVHAICALTYADFLHARMHLFLLVSHPHTHTLVHTLELLRSNSWCQCAPWGLWALKSVRFNSPTGSSVWVKISSHSQRIFIQTQAHILGIWFHSYRSPTASLEFMQSILWCSLRKCLCFFVSAQLKVAAYCSLITASFFLLICAHLITFMSPLEFCIIHPLLRCFLSVHFLSVFAFCYFCSLLQLLFLSVWLLFSFTLIFVFSMIFKMSYCIERYCKTSQHNANVAHGTIKIKTLPLQDWVSQKKIEKKRICLNPTQY